ncbi:Uncharacterized protein SCF082_LOCUS16843 [Durusdinium trenchii]|uniref:DUF1275 domain protein n=1 Tax=Durusdinium trenchii TaxID=1381693 RepID=A0ABP0KDP6_9DINO
MVSSDRWRFQKHAVIASLFALVSGYADVITLVRYQAFANILTGNAIYLGRVTVNPQSDDKHTGWFYVAVCGSFAVGAFMQRLCELRWPNRGGSTAAVPLALLMMGTEVTYLATDINYHRHCLGWTVVFVAPLFGVVSAACSTGRMGIQTTMVTGHTLTVTQLLARLLFGETLTILDLRKLFMSIMVIAGTVSGACLGSLTLMSFRGFSERNANLLLFPVPVLLYTLLWLHDHLAKPRSLIKRVQKKLRSTAELPMYEDSKENGVDSNDDEDDEDGDDEEEEEEHDEVDETEITVQWDGKSDTGV